MAGKRDGKGYEKMNRSVPTPYPFVCANCKYAEIEKFPSENREMVHCHRYPTVVDEEIDDWCAEFSAAVGRSMREDLKFPPCQVVNEYAGKPLFERR